VLCAVSCQVYWVQAEAIQAFWVLFKATGDPRYLNMLHKTLQFINQHMRDHKFGE
jgi:mannose/cellobiose epimerase-like protein (N-acyl-D-glucosamine 2-epimerase family)